MHNIKIIYDIYLNGLLFSKNKSKWTLCTLLISNFIQNYKSNQWIPSFFFFYVIDFMKFKMRFICCERNVFMSYIQIVRIIKVHLLKIYGYIRTENKIKNKNYAFKFNKFGLCPVIFQYKLTHI